MRSDDGVVVSITRFENNLARYVKVMGKTIWEALQDEARLTAQAMIGATPPYGVSKKKSKDAKAVGAKKQGQNRVKSDIARVYQSDRWWLEEFQWQNKSLGERVRELVRAKDAGKLEKIFASSPRLSRTRIEPFNSDKHKKARRNGAIGKGYWPGSYPLTQQAKSRKYANKKAKNVGTLKSGWAQCWWYLGGKPPKWLKLWGIAGDNGEVINQRDKQTVTLINRINYASRYMGNYTFAMMTRKKKLQASMKRAIKNPQWGK